MIKKIFGVLALSMVMLLCGCNNYESQDILRLHVIANSNSAFDQSVKLKVKDEVSRIMADKGITTYEQAIYIATQEREIILETANRVLQENGAAYKAEMEVGVYHFPERTYGDLTFKEGKYNAVRLKLGQAQGENWWCVLFPPLCFLDSGNGFWDLSFDKEVEFKSLLAQVLK